MPLRYRDPPSHRRFAGLPEEEYYVLPNLQVLSGFDRRAPLRI